MEQKHMFTNKMIADLLIPVVLEQLLNSIMGTADTMMVSNVGSAAISAVSLVDSINVLVIQAFSALAAGGAIVCAPITPHNNAFVSRNHPVILFFPYFLFFQKSHSFLILHLPFQIPYL